MKSRLSARLEELAQLGWTLLRRREDVLAYFDASASNGPVEALNDRLENLRRIALGFRNLHHFRMTIIDPLRRAADQKQPLLNPKEPKNLTFYRLQSLASVKS